jgi:hypothetical protein
MPTATLAEADALDLALASAALDSELARSGEAPAKPWSDAGWLAKAFGEGADARLHGLPTSANPHESWSVDWTWWNRGWHDVDRHYGDSVCNRWPVRPLPAVQQLAVTG